MGGWDLQKTALLIAAVTDPDLEAASTADDVLLATRDGSTTALLILRTESTEAAAMLGDDG